MRITSVKNSWESKYNGYNRLTQVNPITFVSRSLLFEDIDKLIQNGQLNDVKQLPDPYVINSRRESLLHSAAQNEQLEISKFLLNKKLDPNLRNFRGRSPFAIACSKLNKPLIEQFLLYDVDVNTYDNQRNTPLHRVVTDPKLVKLLLDHGANPYFENEFQQTPFNLAIKYKNTLEMFLKCRTNPNHLDKNGQTLLYSAIKSDDLEAAEILKKYKANLNHKDNQGKSPIFYTTNLQTTQWLHKNGANLNQVDNNGQTVLHKMISENNYDISSLLLKLGANPNINDKYNLPPLYYAKRTKTMELLLQNNGEPNVITPQGSTLLHNCVKSKNINATKLLLKYNANPNILDKDKKIPFDYSFNNPSIRKMLLDAGSDTNYRNYLIIALKSRNSKFFEELLEYGANPNVPNATGKTAVFYVNSSKDIEELTKHNANLKVFNKDGYAPIHHFALLGREDIVNILKKDFKADVEQATNGKTLDDCRDAYKKYHKWLKQGNPKTSQVVFTGNPDSNDYRFYGIEDNRKDLAYKIKLTPEKIDAIIQSAPTTEIGILTAYTQLNEEKGKINKSIRAFSVIRNQYNEKFKMEISQLYNRNPKGSKIPIIGIVAQYSETVLTNAFTNRLINETDKLTALYDSICEHYYQNGIHQQIEDYLALNKYLSEGIEYVNYIESKNPKYEKYLEKLEQSKTQLTQTDTKIADSLTSTKEKYQREYGKMLEYQEKKQTKRIAKKTTTILVSGGS